MMKRIVLLFVLTSMLFSCNDENQCNQGLNELEGSWNLISVTCLCEPINLEKGQQIWEFDLTQKELKVTNHVTTKLHTILETGVYSITITSNKVTIVDTNYTYYFKDEKLYLADNPASDGPLIELIK